VYREGLQRRDGRMPPPPIFTITRVDEERIGGFYRYIFHVLFFHVILLNYYLQLNYVYGNHYDTTDTYNELKRRSIVFGHPPVFITTTLVFTTTTLF
jgi:hypothetical protein